MNLSDRMKTEAVSLGLCAQWTAEWEDKSSKDAMIDKFVRGIDFCIKHNWPSPAVIKRDFGDRIHAHGVYVDEVAYLHNPKGVVVLNGNCDAHITFDSFSVATVYVRHTSKLSITTGGFAKVRVCLHDNGVVNVKCSGNSKCNVFQYGGTVRTNEGGTVYDRLDFAKENFVKK